MIFQPKPFRDSIIDVFSPGWIAAHIYIPEECMNNQSIYIVFLGMGVYSIPPAEVRPLCNIKH